MFGIVLASQVLELKSVFVMLWWLSTCASFLFLSLSSFLPFFLSFPPTPLLSLLFFLISWLNTKKYQNAAAKSLQSCPTLSDPIDGSPPGSSVPGFLQARTLEWVAISFSNACMLSRFSHVWLCATLWAPLSMGFSRQEYWSGLPFPSPKK